MSKVILTGKEKEKLVHPPAVEGKNTLTQQGRPLSQASII